MSALRAEATDSARAVGTVLASPRSLALASAVTLVAALAAVLRDVTAVVGGAGAVLAVVGLAFLAATGLARVLRVRTAGLLGAAVVAAGLALYLAALDVALVATADEMLGDALAMATGLSVLRLQALTLWAMAYAPAPVFLTWFLALHRRYVGAAATGGAALGLFVLTGDAGQTVVLFGALGAIGTAGFGHLDRFGSEGRGVETLAAVLAVAVLVTTTVGVVPGGAGQPLDLSGDGGTGTLHGSLTSADQRVRVQGALDLSATLLFTVRSDRAAYWRVAAYDRYTGDGWVRTGGQQNGEAALSAPPGGTLTVVQQYTVESAVNVMPAAWRPVSVSGPAAADALVTEAGGLQPAGALTAGEEYTVTSERLLAPPSVLRSAGRDYPGKLASRYTQLPRATPQRVAERTARITAGAETPYETARRVEHWLEANRAYSLDVQRPSGSVADAFLFEMEAGYCTYYATTMVTMLRTQGIPARFVVGYTTGESVGENRYEVRGLHSHAWVEVYFPDVGWVRFDPTPTGPRRAAEGDALSDAGVSDDETKTTPTPDRTTGPTGTAAPIDTVEPPGAGPPGGDDGPLLPSLPSRGTLALALVVLVGVVAGARRTGLAGRAYRAVWLRYQPRVDPHADAERAFGRVEAALARADRPRRPDETPRQYLAAVEADAAAWRAYETYERARYGGAVADEAAAAAVEAADAVVAKHVRFLPGR